MRALSVLQAAVRRFTSGGAVVPWGVVGVCALLVACGSDPLPLPTEAEVRALDRAAEAPLYQLLYEAPVLPESQVVQQKVRLLIWLRHMGLNTGQLDLLEALRAELVTRRRTIADRERDLAQRWEGEENIVYTELWTQLAAGVAVDAPEMTELVDRLRELRGGGERERELVTLRLEATRAALDAQGPFLRTLTPRQEQLLNDAVFFLRRRLDPVANPGDFRALVGTTYEPGQYAVLTRGLSEQLSEPLDIGGLWSDGADERGHPLHDARREVLLMLALLEPGLEPAIAAARELAESGDPGGPTAPQPGPGQPTPPPPAPPGAP